MTGFCVREDCGCMVEPELALSGGIKCLFHVEEEIASLRASCTPEAQAARFKREWDALRRTSEYHAMKQREKAIKRGIGARAILGIHNGRGGDPTGTMAMPTTRASGASTERRSSMSSRARLSPDEGTTSNNPQQELFPRLRRGAEQPWHLKP